LPKDWKNLKIDLEKKATDLSTRGGVFKSLHDFDSGYKIVADFLTEFCANCFPKDFLIGKNKKVFNKKVYTFVKFNRFE
jgi:hypothetical protein